MSFVQPTATRTNRSLVSQSPDRARDLRARRIVLANPILLFYRRIIDSAVADAKKTRHGLPTDIAIVQRWWIADFHPGKANKAIWFGSFAGACEMLGMDAAAKRKEYLADIDDVLVRAAVQYAGDEVYRRRAQVLACAGVPTRIGRQYVLGLVDRGEHEEIAGLDRPDPPQRKRKQLVRGGQPMALSQPPLEVG